jgi:predicted nuclease with TOPRIM domain
MVGDGRTVRGGFMSNVVSLQYARERAWQSRGGSKGHATKELAQSVWKSQTTERDGRIASNQKLLERLEAENAQLRENVVELVLQIQALRDRTRTLTA